MSAIEIASDTGHDERATDGSSWGAGSILAGHEAEILVPGSFVVLHGSDGDGCRNSMDSLPPLVGWSSAHSFSPAPSPRLQPRGNPSGGGNEGPAPLSPSEDSYAVVEDTNAATTGSSLPLGVNTPTVGQLAASNTTLGGLTAMGALAAPLIATTTTTNATLTASNGASTGPLPEATRSDSTDSFVVVTDHEGSNGIGERDDGGSAGHQPTTPLSPLGRRPLPPRARASLEQWNTECRERERFQREEWKESVAQMTRGRMNHAFLQSSYYAGDPEEPWWLTDSGKIAILGEVPTLGSDGEVVRTTLGSISPGSTVVATDIVYLDSQTLRRIDVAPLSPPSDAASSTASMYPRGRPGWICLVRVEAFRGQETGWAALSLDGYPLMAPGLPSLYSDPEVWIWRVTCCAGAFVRQGLDLNSQHLDTLPYGSLVRVTRRTVNEQGLCRLRVTGVLEDSTSQPENDDASQPQSQQRLVDGWCSEFLNPLSGNRGSVLKPLAFPVPALYRVTLEAGAVVRSDVELGSPIIGTLPRGTILRVVGRAFSEHPIDRCIERLRLAGKGGWISVRLNLPAPHDHAVVEAVGVDGSFDPEQPGPYHWRCLGEQKERQRRANEDSEDVRDLSSVDTSGEDDEVIEFDDGVDDDNNDAAASRSLKPIPPKDVHCVICLTEERNATIVHGETGHVACCLACARILQARGDKCPVCRLDIDLVIQHFWA